VAGISQASAMLTDVVLATLPDGEIPSRPRSYQLRNPGAMKARVPGLAADSAL
jgi:hypothetical protein